MTRKIICGFHLIELLIALSIMSILAMISIPSYQEYYRHTHRLQAINALSQLTLAMEKYYFAHNSYRQASLQNLHFPEFLGNVYHLKIYTQSAFNYLLKAVPIGSQRKDQCGILTINEHHETKAKRASCWQ